MPLQAALHVEVGRFDQLPRRRGVNLAFRSELYMAHELSAAFQQAARIGKFGAQKEPDIDMRREDIDMAERCIAYTRGRMAVMKQLPDILTAVRMTSNQRRAMPPKRPGGHASTCRLPALV